MADPSHDETECVQTPIQHQTEHTLQKTSMGKTFFETILAESGDVEKPVAEHTSGRSTPSGRNRAGNMRGMKRGTKKRENRTEDRDDHSPASERNRDGNMTGKKKRKSRTEDQDDRSSPSERNREGTMRGKKRGKNWRQDEDELLMKQDKNGEKLVVDGRTDRGCAGRLSRLLENSHPTPSSWSEADLRLLKEQYINGKEGIFQVLQPNLAYQRSSGSLERKGTLTSYPHLLSNRE